MVCKSALITLAAAAGTLALPSFDDPTAPVKRGGDLLDGFGLCPYASNWWNLGVYGNNYSPDQQNSGNTVVSIDDVGGEGPGKVTLSSPEAYQIPQTLTKTSIVTLTETAHPQNQLVALTMTLQPSSVAHDIGYQRNFAPHSIGGMKTSFASAAMVKPTQANAGGDAKANAFSPLAGGAAAGAKASPAANGAGAASLAAVSPSAQAQSPSDAKSMAAWF